MAKNIKPEVVVITGGSAGVGRAIAREFARKGARVALLARGEEGLKEALKEIEELGGTGITVKVDVSEHEQVERAAERVEAELGPIDIWINNAMNTVFSPFKEIEAEEFKRVTEVTYHGYVYGTMSALKRMIARNKGTIVQIGSALAYRSIPLQSAYCGSKFAIRGFTDSIRSELIHDKSKVNITMVHLPAVNTPQFDWGLNKMEKKAQPVPPIFQPEVIARAVYWAAHHRKRELFLGLPVWKAIIGNKLIPGLLDRYLASKGYEGQLTDKTKSRKSKANLWKPVDARRDYGAHGSFDDRAKNHSPAMWLSTRGRAVVPALVIAGVSGVVGTLLLKK